MSAVEPARHALYSRLEEVIGREHAETLMTHLPLHRADEVATKADIATLQIDVDARFDRLEDRFDRLEDRFERWGERMDRNQRFFVGTALGTLTVMTAIFSFVVSLLT